MSSLQASRFRGSKASRRLNRLVTAAPAHGSGPTCFGLGRRAIAGRVTNIITGEVVHDYDKNYPQRVRSVYGGIVIPDSPRGPENVYDAVTGKLITTLPPIKGVLYNFLYYSR